MTGLAFGAWDTIVDKVAGGYPSFPFAWRDSSGNSHVVYRDASSKRSFADGGTTSGTPIITSASALAADVGQAATGTGIPSNAYVIAANPGVSITLNLNATATAAAVSVQLGAEHSTGGAFWYRRNNAAGVLLFDFASEGGPIQDTFVFQRPSDGKIVFLERMGTAESNRVAISNDLGVTVGAMSAIVLPPELKASGAFFSDITLSMDGTELIAAVYGWEPAQSGTNWSVACWRSTDGVTWTHRAWIARYNDAASAAGKANETGFARLPRGRLVAAMRHHADGNPGFTSYSDDEGVTWSARIQPNTTSGLAGGNQRNNFGVNSPTRGVPVRADRVAVAGRYFGGATNGTWIAWWLLDDEGGYVGGPYLLHATSQGAYVALIKESEGLVAYSYTNRNVNDENEALIRSTVRVT